MAITREGDGGPRMIELTQIERETIINFNAGEKTASVYTRDPAVFRRFDSLCTRDPEHYKLVRADELGREYSMPKKLLAYRVPVKYSEERKREMAEQLKRYREAGNGKEG